MPKKKMPMKKSSRSVWATVKYPLSEEGRRESLLNGGDGKPEQVSTGLVDEASIGWFTLEEDGSLSYDLTFEKMWDVGAGASDDVQTWDNLLEIIRKHELERAQEIGKKEDAARAFLDDPDLRADDYHDGAVTVSGYQFDSPTFVFIEAQFRRKSDREALEQRNQHTMARWIKQYGDTNQKERLAAGLLPWEEASHAIDFYYFKQLSHLIGGTGDEDKLPLYRRFVIEDICECRASEEDVGDLINGYKPARRLCKPQFLTAEPAELSAGEWNNLSRIKKMLAETWPGETYNVGLREHRAKCRSTRTPLLRRTAIVTVSLDELSFEREILLTGVCDDEFPF